MFRSYTFSFEEVRPEKSVLMEYLQIPDAESYSLVSEIVEKTFSGLANSKEIIGGYRILDCKGLDIREGTVFCQLEKLVAVIRSREVSLCLLYQQLAQCKAIYDKHAETILGNMDSVVFLGGREASTIKEISENWLGKATISMQTDSRSRGQSESYSQNTQRLGRELMTPAELATMPGDKCILQLRGLPPFFSPKYDLKRHPNYRYTAEADKQKNAFDLDRLINRRRRPGLNEACTMYEVAVPDDALTEEDEDILNYDDIDDPDAFA